MTYTYKCVYHPFGCNFTRTRRNAMEKHVKVCPYAEKFKVYIDAVAENIMLKRENASLRIQKGRPKLILKPVDFDEFTEKVLSDKRHIEKILSLAKRYQRALVDAVITYFIFTSPRFFKVLNTSEVDLIIRMGGIRTFGRVETHEMQEFVEELYESVSYFLEDEHTKFGFRGTKNMKLSPDVSKRHCLFVYNTFRQSVTQRQHGGPITMNDVEVSMVLEEKKQVPENAKVKVL